jgi:hypothetical protein
MEGDIWARSSESEQRSHSVREAGGRRDILDATGKGTYS